MDWECPPLLILSRDSYIEAVHRGCIAVVASDGRQVCGVGHVQLPTILRSAAKPFQLMAVLSSGAPELFELSGEELAVAAASHNAEEEHLAAVRSILSKTGMTQKQLRCGIHPAFAPHVSEKIARAGKKPEQIHNNCSGKHAAMLAACLARGWPTETYDRLEHPLQQENLERIARFSGVRPQDVGIVVDGCGVPAFVLPLSKMALAFARLADPANAPEPDRELARRTKKIITGHPTYGSGKLGRLEAQLMAAGKGNLVAKVGAEGVYGVGIAPGVLGERGFGVALTLSEGITFNRATDPILVATLRQLGVINDNDLELLADFAPRDVFNCRGEKVGRMSVQFELTNGSDG